MVKLCNIEKIEKSGTSKFWTSDPTTIYFFRKVHTIRKRSAMKITPGETLVVMDRLQLSIDRYAHLIEEHLGGGNTDIANCLSAI
jgi:hypothetical protein